MKKFYNKKKNLPYLMIFNQDGVAIVEIQKGKFTVKSRQLTNGGAVLELWAVEILKKGQEYPVAIYSDRLTAQIEDNRLFKFIDSFRPNQAFQFRADDIVDSALAFYEESKIAGYF